MANGRTKPIEKIKVGDRVLATDTASVQTSPQTVTALIFSQGAKNLVQITSAAGGSKGEVAGALIATETHPFWSLDKKDWVEAGRLRPGLSILASPASAPVRIIAVDKWTTQNQRVHNLTVANEHTYYAQAGTTPVLVHNDECPVSGRSHGRLGEAATKDRLTKEGYTDIVQEVRFKNSKGEVFRADFVARDKNGNWVAVEVKPVEVPGLLQIKHEGVRN
ncbi:polymorphic toxin-type HINT domain-containing protein [Nonomuraea sp. NPDC050790]|uniref:polymorphic toxin-type HINT domain-containing protein n=1 Tax=Nonomuraea sp. NPDC050790 TaxID=3364371 RepID=UPI0037BDE8DC